MHSPRPVPAENTLRGWTAGALYHNPARCARMRQSEQIARVNAPKSARKATSTPHCLNAKTQIAALLQRIGCVYFRNGAFTFARYEKFLGRDKSHPCIYWLFCSAWNIYHYHFRIIYHISETTAWRHCKGVKCLPISRSPPEGSWRSVSTGYRPRATRNCHLSCAPSTTT